MVESERDKRWANGDGYNRYITKELTSFRKKAWKEQILKHLPKDVPLNILDVGTGPGFFACILSEEGHHVTAIDKSDGMLACARENAASLAVSPLYLKMDINQLCFADDSFDIIVTRNVTWTLEHPEEVYANFKRILKPGGKLLIYDANWHMHFFDEALMERVRAREQRHLEKYGSSEVVSGNDKEYFLTLPPSNTDRPQWDHLTLSRLGFIVEVEEDIGRWLYEDWEKELYGESPLFEVLAIKPEMSEDKTRVKSYWQKRAASFGFDASDEALKECQNRINGHLPEGRLKVLDAGTGPGFIATVFALLGHEVTGVDLCSKMIEQAKANTEQLGLSLTFLCTDAGELPFEDNTFDVIVSRNVIWALTNPVEVLESWRRVLKPGGTLMYFDGNHYYYLFNEDDRKARDAYIARHGLVHDAPVGVDFSEMERAAKSLPLSKENRPDWDINILPTLGFEVTYIELKSPQDKEKEQEISSSCYYNTFMMVAKKLPDNLDN